MIEQAVLTCDALGENAVIQIRGAEAMNDLSTFYVDVICADPGHDPTALMATNAGLTFGDGAEGLRNLSLVVSRASYAGPHRDGHRYQLTLTPAAHVLTFRRAHRVFQEKSTQEIVAEILRGAGIPDSEVKWRLGGKYGKRVYTVQYGEFEWDFIKRLLADEGINLWFDYQEDGTSLLVFGDGTGAHSSIDGDPGVLYEDPGALVGSAGTLFALELTHELSTDRVHIQDFDVRQPDVLINGETGSGSLAYYEYPAKVLNSDAAAYRAAVRLEQLSRFAQTAVGQSMCARLAAGRVVKIAGVMDDHFAGPFLITRVEHDLRQASRNAAAEGRPYTNKVWMVPFDKKAFRPDLPKPAPRVFGLETATVTGPGGEEIHVDDLGAVKVRFPWDRSGIGDDKSSRWVRTMQMNMQGAMLLPRMGWEVPVAYLEGDPDKPYCLGRLYNGGAPVPYGQPAKKATTTFQSATSPGDGTTQEIRLSDDAGAMEAFIHATKDQSVKVGGTNQVTVGVNETHDVKKSTVLNIASSQTTSIGANQKITVGGDDALIVKGSRTESIGAVENIGVTGSYNLICNGAYTEAIGGLYGLECNQSNTTVQGSYTQTVAGAMSITAGLGTNNTVAAARLEDVGGVRSFTSSNAYADSVIGAKKVTAGKSSDNAGTVVATNVGGLGSISTGAGADINASGAIMVKAASITIKVGGSLTAKAGGQLTVGGNVKVSGGTAKFDASKTTKKSTSKVG
ncbi:MAG: type VI secretion system tip protein VgrG [Polyangiaceae bacterium]|nr:type VI secretion system tip protein VgrG [Polyangiaceae bacterium]